MRNLRGGFEPTVVDEAAEEEAFKALSLAEAEACVERALLDCLAPFEAAGAVETTEAAEAAEATEATEEAVAADEEPAAEAPAPEAPSEPTEQPPCASAGSEKARRFRQAVRRARILRRRTPDQRKGVSKPGVSVGTGVWLPVRASI